jgi:hypothetical protein
MRWVLAILFGLIGYGIGFAITSHTDSTVQKGVPILVGALLAILGAVLGGASDIVRAIHETNEMRRGSDRHRTDQERPSA